MQATREIFWNVGHWAIILTYFFALIAVVLCVRGFILRIPVYRKGKYLCRRDRFSERIPLMLGNIISQRQVLRVPGPGILHALFFWGFGLLFLGTLLIMAQIDFTQPFLGVAFLKGNFYRLYSLVLDIAGTVTLLMVGGLMVRRFILKPESLATTLDDCIAHALLFAVLVTGFVVEGIRIAATELQTNPGLASFSPVGILVGQLFVGMSAVGLERAHKVFWWVHLFLSLGFIAAIPYMKLRHLFTSSANYFFTDLSPKGTIASLDVEDENTVQYGAANVSDLTWKDIFDADACMSCGRCQDRCPAWETSKPLSPMKVIQQIGEIAFTNQEASLADIVSGEAIWACTTCRACQEICPAYVEHVNKILEMRRNLALMEGAFPGDEVRVAVNNVEVTANPFGIDGTARGEWASGLDVRIVDCGSEVEILYFVGCFASFDRRNQEVARNFVKICNAAGVTVGIMGKKEVCCGEPVRKLGNEYLYQLMAWKNIERIKGSGVKKIVTACPHCFNTLVRDYRDLGFDVPVEHSVTYISGLIKNRRLVLKPERFQFTYHDSCYLGRYMDIINEPRDVLAAAGGQITEMAKSEYDTFCCGGGGGLILAEENVGSRINAARVEMARKTGVPKLVSSCPFCLTMFEDAIKSGGWEGELQAKDLVEIVAERMER